MKFARNVTIRVAAAFGWILPSAATQDFESLAPAGTWLFVGCDDWRSLVAAAQQSEFARLLDDPGLADFASAVAERFDAQMKLGERDDREKFAEIGELLTGPACLFSLDPVSADPSFQGSFTEAAPLAFIVSGGERNSELFSKFEEELAETESDGSSTVTRETREVDGVSVVVFHDDDGAGEVRITSLAEVGGRVVVVSALQPGAKVAADHLDGLLRAMSVDDGVGVEGRASLATNPNFTESIAARTDSGLRIYLDATPIMRQFKANAEEEVENAEAPSESDGTQRARARRSTESKQQLVTMQALGLDRLARFALCGSLDGDGLRVEMEAVSGGEIPFFAALGRVLPTAPFELPANCPAGAMNVFLAHLDLSEALLAFSDLAASIDPQAKVALDEALAQMAAAGFDLRKELFEPIGDEFAVIRATVSDEQAMPGTEDDPSSAALVIELDDAAAIEALVDRFVDSQGLIAVRRKEEFEGRVLYTLPTPFGLEATYCFAGRRLVASLSSELARDVLRRIGEHDLPTLANDEHYQRGLSAVGADSQSMAFVADAARIVFAMLKGMAQNVAVGSGDGATPQPEVEIDVVRKYVSGYSLFALAVHPDRTVLRLRIGGAGK